MCMYLACYFRQRTYVAQGLIDGVLNETWTHSCSQFECFSIWLWVLYRGYPPFFLECVYLSLLYASLIFDMFLLNFTIRFFFCFKICKSPKKILKQTTCINFEAAYWSIFFFSMLLFTNPSARAGYDTRSIFKRSLTGFEFRVFLLLD